jgi:uncharacterized protein involved in outer membrane biogenesis
LKMQTVIKWIGIALGLLVVGIGVLVLVFDWNWIKGSLEREASKALGRTVVIEGDLDVKLSWSPLVRMEHMRMGQPNWTLGQARPAENSPTPLSLPNIGEVRLREGHVTDTDYASHKEIAATLTEVHATTMDPEQRLKIEGVGSLPPRRCSSPYPPVHSKTSAPIGRPPCRYS